MKEIEPLICPRCYEETAKENGRRYCPWCDWRNAAP